MNNSQVNLLAKQEGKLSKQEILYINKYLKTGNSTQAYIRAFNIPKKNYHLATVKAAKLKQKISNIDAIYFERAGLDIRLISSVLKQALRAKRPFIYKGIHEYPDHNIRLKAIETFQKLTTIKEKERDISVMQGLQIIIQR
ncbi:MAG: hypothetical protein LC122_07355 [Chitinophagales bacterium]|nr:hypothetical protein [Chitinophagales bacterium]